MSPAELEAPRTVAQALAYARAEHDRESRDWTGYCLVFVRTCYGIPALFGSAYALWLGADDDDRHPGGNPADAPLGSALLYKGSGPYGHIMLAANKTMGGQGAAGAWSNDLVRGGDIDHVARTAPTTVWGQRYLGHLTAVNNYDLPLTTGGPAEPRSNRYAAIDKAIDRMERALARAVDNDEKKDAKVIRTEIQHLRELYRDLRWTA